LAQEIHVGPRLSSRQRHIGKHRLLGTCACGLAFRPKMRVPERTYTSLPVAGPPAPAGEQCDTSGQCAIGMQPTRLQLMMVAATIGSAIVGTLVLLTRAWPRQQQAVHNTSLSALMVKPGWPPTTDSQDEVTLKFPISFEDAYAGRCPDGFTCTGFSKVCKHPALTQSCTHPGIANVDGKKYLLVGNDKDSATATSVPFYLPSKITSIRWLRSGGSDAPSGISVRLVGSGESICKLQGGQDTNIFFEEVCDGLADYPSQAVYICIVNTHVGVWSKVLVDDIHLQDQWGNSLNHAGHAHLSPTTRLDCPTS